MLRLFDDFKAVVFFFFYYFLDFGYGLACYGLVFVFLQVDGDSEVRADSYWPAGENVSVELGELGKGGVSEDLEICVFNKGLF